MFHINKKIANTITCAFLASSLALPGCGVTTKESTSNNNEILYNEEPYKYVSNEITHITAVCNNGNISIIIPISNAERSYIHYGDGFLSLFYDIQDNFSVFNSSNLYIFYSNSHMSSYEQAYNFASSISDTVYLYKDVIEGNPINLINQNSKQKTL